jgi:arylsulfatase A-like enzyme
MIFRFPPLLGGGKVWQSGVSLVDLAPTILDVCGVYSRAGDSPRSRSLLPDLRAGRDHWRRPIVMQNISRQTFGGSYFEDRAIRNERWKLVVRKFDASSGGSAAELYELSSDPGETHDVLGANRAVGRDLAAQLRTWGEEMKDPLAVELATVV